EALGEEVGPVPAYEARLLGVEQRPLFGPEVLGEAPAGGRKPQLELAPRLLAHPPGLEQLAARLAGRAVPQHVLVVPGGELEHVEDALAQVGALLLIRAQLLQLHAGPLGEHLQRAALVRLLDQLHERENVALALAAEAVPGLALTAHVEARAVL